MGFEKKSIFAPEKMNKIMIVKKEILNENIEYEKFVQDIYQTLLDSEDIMPTKVQHNVDIMGRSGCSHQIDVYWEYEIAGVKHRVAIECKNYNTSDIAIGRIRDFFAALIDIGNINGIFVCKNGYQSGAIKFADFYGINLIELRVPVDSDWEGRIQTIQFDLLAIGRNIKQRLPLFDIEWFKANIPNPVENRHIQMEGNSNEIIIKDKNGNKITDIYELDNKLPSDGKEEENREHEYKWEDAYIDVKNLGAIKISSLKYIYDVRITEPESIIISGKDTAKAILKDVKTGSIKFFDTKGNIK
jgi:hypothetical protein